MRKEYKSKMGFGPQEMVAKEGKRKGGDTHIKTQDINPSRLFPSHHHPLKAMHSQVNMTRVLERGHISQSNKEYGDCELLKNPLYGENMSIEIQTSQE